MVVTDDNNFLTLAYNLLSHTHKYISMFKRKIRLAHMYLWIGYTWPKKKKRGMHKASWGTISVISGLHLYTRRLRAMPNLCAMKKGCRWCRIYIYKYIQSTEQVYWALIVGRRLYLVVIEKRTRTLVEFDDDDDVMNSLI